MKYLIGCKDCEKERRLRRKKLNQRKARRKNKKLSEGV